MVEEDWANMIESKKSDEVQFRLKKTWVNQDGMRSNIWVQSSGYPQVDEQGNVTSRSSADSQSLARANIAYWHHGHTLRH